MGEMENNGGKRRGLGGGGGDSGHSTRDMGCGGLWQEVVERNGRTGCQGCIAMAHPSHRLLPMECRHFRNLVFSSIAAP